MQTPEHTLKVRKSGPQCVEQAPRKPIIMLITKYGQQMNKHINSCMGETGITGSWMTIHIHKFPALSDHSKLTANKEPRS